MTQITTLPVTPERWPDLVSLFGERGAASGCWCMWFRVSPREWSSNGSAGNRAALEAIVAEQRTPGLLAYRDGRPAGWISVAPRADFARIEPQAGEKGVWSVVCFYIEAGQRGGGVASALLAAGIDHARRQGARVLEAYPVERAGASNADAFTGPRSLFEKAGFRETGRFDRWAAIPHASGDSPRRLARPPGRPIMRLEL
ncbi:MAG TPA: GNAT family N-acetyltransferase [Candidatus Limnocylindria bacterium]|nr:GNAT family N-acetyltransferase [Candidatus Limnocylindria bacterium]